MISTFRNIFWPVGCRRNPRIDALKAAGVYEGDPGRVLMDDLLGASVQPGAFDEVVDAPRADEKVMERSAPVERDVLCGLDGRIPVEQDVAEAARKAGVGPMAAVAVAVAEYVGRAPGRLPPLDALAFSLCFLR